MSKQGRSSFDSIRATTRYFRIVGQPEIIPDPFALLTRSVSVLVSVRFAIQCYLLRRNAPGLTTMRLCLQDNVRLGARTSEEIKSSLRPHWT